jgi:erythromycin esterase
MRGTVLTLALLATLALAAGAQDDWRAAALPLGQDTPARALEALPALGSARLVVLGDASGGSAELVSWRRPLLEHLWGRGFTVLALQTGFADTAALDAWVRQGTGRPLEAQRRLLYWNWKTQEMAALIGWLRSHDEQAPLPVSVAGFDMLYPAASAREVENYLAGYGVERSFVQGRLGPLSSQGRPEEMTRLDPSRRRAVQEGCDLVLSSLTGLPSLLTSGNPRRHREVLQAARVVSQAARYWSSPDEALRQQFLAENLAWLAEEAFPGQKIVVWMGNDQALGCAPWLRRRYGSQVYVLGSSLYQGSILAPGPQGRPQPLTLAPAQPDSAEALLHSAGLPGFVVDLERVPDLARPRPARWAGPDGRPRTETLALGQVFDAILHVDHSTAATPLPEEP